MEATYGTSNRWLRILVISAALLAALYYLRGVLTPVFFAFLIAYLLDPLVRKLEQWKVPRAAGIAVILAGFLLLLTAFLVLLIPQIAEEVARFAKLLPAKLNAWSERLEPWLATYDLSLPHSWDELSTQMGLNLQAVAGKAAAPVAAALGWMAGGTASLLGAAAGLLMVPVFAFYLLYDFERLRAASKELLPWRARNQVLDMAAEVDEVLAQFIRGQLLVMLLLTVLYAVGYSLVGVPLALAIAVAGGVLSFIPYVGGAVALGLALLMSFLDFQGWGQIAAVVGIYTAVQLLEGFVITPKVMGETVGLPGVWVLFALLVGGELFGFMGVLLAVPVAAVAKVFIVRVVAQYRASELYLRGAPSEVATRPLPWGAENLPPTMPPAAQVNASAPSSKPASDREAQENERS